jgi:hypothetical protein
MRHGIHVLMVVGSVLAVALPCRAIDFSDFGLHTSISEIITLERLNRSVRFDPVAAVESEWRGIYDRVTVVELPSVQNRYALFESDRLRRCDIAIRGTVNLKNAIFDLEFLKDRSAALGIHLHSGFERVATVLYADLRPRLRPGYALRVAGHSLGAAEAEIVGMLLTRDGYAVEKILASAPPKVTDAEGWARFKDLPVVRVAGPYDPVPFLPPRGPLYGRNPYTQGGDLILLLDGAKFTIVGSSFYDDLPDAVKQVYADGRHFDAADHLLLKYLERLLPKAAGVEFVDAANWDRYASPAER